MMITNLIIHDEYLIRRKNLISRTRKSAALISIIVMFAKPKIPKLQKPANLPLYFHRFHTQVIDDYNTFWTQDYRQLLIIDIGWRNLCRRISRRYFNPKKVKALVFDKVAIPVENDDENYRILFQELEFWLQQYHQEYFNCHVIIIEWQLPVNYNAVRISTFILTYFILLLKDSPLFPFLLEMRSGFKDDYFPVLKPLNQHARKDKCEELGRDLLTLMDDQESLLVMNAGVNHKKKKKQDDYADTVLMEEVFCQYAASKDWLFPHYKNARKIVLRQPIQRMDAKDEVIDDTLHNEAKEPLPQPRHVNITVTPRRPSKVKVVIKKSPQT